MTPEEIFQHKQKLEFLERQVEIVRKEKELLQERYDLLCTQKAVEDKNYKTALSVAQLDTDWLAKAKELETLKAETDIELRDAICIDFANKLRVNALKDIDKDPDNILVIKATAYEVYYRACVATLENRNLKVKINARDRFNEAVKQDKTKRVEKEGEKLERQRAQDPREKMIQGMIALGFSREDAEKQLGVLNSAAKELVKK